MYDISVDFGAYDGCAFYSDESKEFKTFEEAVIVFAKLFEDDFKDYKVIVRESLKLQYNVEDEDISDEGFLYTINLSYNDEDLVIKSNYNDFWYNREALNTNEILILKKYGVIETTN